MKKENTMAENELPTGWRTTTLGEVVELVSEKISCNNVDIKIYISTENMLPYKGGVKLAATIPSNGNCSSFEIGDVLFSNIRTYFQKVWLASFKGGSSNDVIIFRPKIKDELNKDYLYYMICNDRFIDYTVLTAKGTKMPRGDKDAIKQYSLFLPSLNEQKAIAKVLSSFDDKIELLQEQNKTLEETAQTIFKEWFGKYQVGDKLPEGWTVCQLSELLEIKYGKDHKNLNDGDVPCYGSGGIMRYVDTPLYSEESILIPRKGTLSNLFLVNEPFWSVDTMFYTKIKNRIQSKFCFLFLKSINLASMDVGSAVPSLTTKILNEINLVVPNNEIMILFDSVVSFLFTKERANLIQLKSLKKTRDELLPKLMNGNLRVKL